MSDATPWMVVGLGNPGAKYAKNRHNIGFGVVERCLAGMSSATPWRDRFSGRMATGEIAGRRCVCLEPMTYMNHSGDSVQPAMAFHKTPIDALVVVHDELDFDFGRVAVKVGGGHGGHNGLRDIIRRLGSGDFTRVRVGIGRPSVGDVSDWVLSDFSASDAAELPDIIDRAVVAVRDVVTDGPTKAMMVHNNKT